MKPSPSVSVKESPSGLMRAPAEIGAAPGLREGDATPCDHQRVGGRHAVPHRALRRCDGREPAQRREQRFRAAAWTLSAVGPETDGGRAEQEQEAEVSEFISRDTSLPGGGQGEAGPDEVLYHGGWCRLLWPWKFMGLRRFVFSPRIVSCGAVGHKGRHIPVTRRSIAGISAPSSARHGVSPKLTVTVTPLANAVRCTLRSAVRMRWSVISW